MSDVALDQVVELALKLSDEEQEILLARVAAHRAHKGEPPPPDERLEWTDEELAELFKPGVPKTGAEIAAMIESGDFEVWSPQDEGGAIAALNRALGKVTR